MSVIPKSGARAGRTTGGVIRVTGARTHNLKNITVEIPRDRLVVLTGVSGSGKSSLAHDTLAAEGQRRYLESVSTWSRTFIEQLERPDVDRVEGLPPTLTVGQRPASDRPRSTLATATEIADFLRLIYARAGVAHSPASGARVERQSVDQIADAVQRFGDRTKVMILAPLIRGRKGEHRATFEKIAKDGFVRARVDGEVVDTAEPPPLNRGTPHTIEAVVDRLIVKEGVRPRLRESVELALKLGEGLCTVSRADGDVWRDRTFSEQFVCPETGESFPPLEPRSFSFNSPYGACPACNGLGVKCNESETERRPAPARNKQPVAILEDASPCPDCHGERLNVFSRNVTLDGLRLPELTALPVSEALAWFITLSEHLEQAPLEQDAEPSDGGGRPLDITPDGRLALARTLPEVINRLRYLDRVGLGYLSLDRPAATLSGGEYRRAQLSGSLGSGLIGVCYVLDEPTIGLHPRDVGRLIDTLCDLRDAGNSLLVVEHDLGVIRSADHLIELGPEAGTAGGRIVAEGTPDQVAALDDSPTGPWLRSRSDAVPEPRPVDSETPSLRLSGIRRHNLAGLDVAIPLGRLVAVTGVSGSGKSTLVMDVLVPAMTARLQGETGKAETGSETRFEIIAAEPPRRLVSVDQSPIGRTPRSTPATYTGVWNDVRKVFARTKAARLRGFNAGRFSFTSSEGRCPECKGQGTTRIEMAFLPDVFAVCPACEGKRFNRQTLGIRFHGRSVADVLAMSIDEATIFFSEVARVRERLELLRSVGLGYLQLGQSALTLSGGEAQRIRLASELSLPGRLATERTLFVLDEPTTGLHPRDVERLKTLLQRLVDDGHTVLVIEHELDLVAAADWVIDLGPEGGAAGGRLVAACSPIELAQHPESHTGRALSKHLAF